MALTATEKTKIIKYLGWPLKTLDSGSTHYNSIVNSRLINLTVEAEALIKGLLTRIEKIDSAMESALCRMSTQQVGDIKLNNMEMDQLKKEYIKRIRELSDATDIKIERSGGVNVGVVV